MARLLTLLCIVLAALASYLASTGASFAERRVALVVANAQYKEAALSLHNPRNDGADVAELLRELGFEVVLSTDVSKRQFDVSLQTFSRIATGADSALFFYAGHAMQFQGRNYLVPVDAELEDDISVRYQTVALDDVNSALQRASGVKILILDACRNNPLANRVNRSGFGATRSGEAVRGLARIGDKTEGMVVAYATAADNVALDGNGRNSPFTAALLNRMREAGLEIEMMFRRVTADVNAATNGRQRPETYVSLLSEYYLNQNDRLAWDRIKDRNDPVLLNDFLSRFPSSIRTIDARRRLELLERLAEERRRDEQNKVEQRLATEREAVRRREEAERQQAALDAQDAERARRLAEERRRDEQNKAEVQRLAVEREAARRREEAERQQAAVSAQEAERARRLAEELRREEERKTAEVQKQAAAEREAARRREEAERQQAALDAQEAERARRRIAEERRREEERKTAELQKPAAAEREAQEAERARQVAEARRLEAEREARENNPREQSRMSVGFKASAKPAVPVPAPPPVDPPPYQLAAVTPPAAPLGSSGKAWVGDPIVDVQLELARLGCFTGEPSGKLDPATKAALQNYYKNTGQKGSVEDVDAAFVASLRLHELRVCVATPAGPAAKPASPAPKVAKPVAPPRRIAAPPRRAPQAAPVAQVAPSVARAPSAPAGGRSVTGVGF